MRPMHPPTAVAPRMKALICRLLVGGMVCALGGVAAAQEFRLSDALLRVPDEAVLQLLRDMAGDAQARAASPHPISETQPIQLADDPQADARPVLVMLEQFTSVAPPPSPAAPPPPQEVLVPPNPPAPVAVQAESAPSPQSTAAVGAVRDEPAALPPPPEAKGPPPVDKAPLASVAPAKTVQPAANSSRDGLPPLGVGDQITIAVFGQPDLSAEVTVGESGTIMVPLIGTLNVLNLSAAQLEAMVAMRLKDGGYLQNPGVSVQIRQLRSQLVSVIGEVQRPGRYPIQGRMTVLEALATAGGLTQRADKTVVLLRKPPADQGPDTQREEISIQLETADGQFRGRLDAPLVNDDVVFVGVQKLFYIHGEVRRPGAYPMESGMNVMKALSLSGGVSERGSDRRIKIHRLDANKVLQELKAEPAMPIRPDDVIHVDERLF